MEEEFALSPNIITCVLCSWELQHSTKPHKMENNN